MTFVEKASKDKRVLALHKSLNRGVYHVDIESLDKEIESLHLRRNIRKLKTIDLMASFNKQFIEAALQNQAYRSRIVEIKVKCYRTAAKLEDHIIVIRGYLKTTYPKTLSSLRTVADRNAAIDSVLEEPIRFLKRLETIDSVAEAIIKDIDQASWALRNIGEVVLNDNKERNAKF